MSESRLPIVVYGATGFTGSLVCRELDDEGVPFAIAGRDAAKLRRLADSLRVPPLVLVARLDDPTSLRRVASSARVVLSCAGPFVALGRPLQDAAIAAGAHWLDTTGELAFVTATRERDAEARERGVALVNAVGLDIVPSDAAATLAASQLPGVERLRIALASRMRPSRGTLKSAAGVAAGGGASWRDGRLVPEPVGADQWEVRFPAPFGTRTCVSAPLADVVTAPASTGARTVQAYVATPTWLARAMRKAPWLARTWAPRPVQKAAHLVIDRLPEGPDAEHRATSAFAVVADAVSGAGATSWAWVLGGDAYDFTAASAAICARLAAAPEFEGRGALSPTQAFGARTLLDALAPAGLKWGLGEP